MESLPAAVVPASVGPYEIRGRLGRGGMGEVFRGHDARLDRPVALKRVQPDRKNPEDARRRFHREARAAAGLSHSSIVKLFDWLEQDGSYWMVMELVEGQSLRALLEGGPLSPGDVARIGLDIAAGLAVAHEAGIVHRDIKPANVMVTTHGEVKILDFGLAKRIAAGTGPMLSSVSASDVIVGTVSAMSPEQALGKPVDGRSDLFSLGALLFELLTGTHPFLGQSAVDTLTRICTAAPPSLDRLAAGAPGELRALVAQLLQKQPDDRPQNADLVVAALEPLAAPRVGLRGYVRASTDSGQSATRAALASADTGRASEPAAADADGYRYRGTDAMESSEPLAAAPAGEVTEALSDVLPPKPEPDKKPERPRWRPRLLSRSWLAVMALAGAVVVAAVVAIGAMVPASGSRESPGAGPESADAAKESEFASLSNHELYSRGMALLRRPDKDGNLDQAIAMFEAAIARDERSAAAHAGLARAYWLRYFSFYDQQGDPSWLERARNIAERAVELDPFLAAARISRGLVYCESGRLDEAARDFREVLRLRPDDPQALWGMGCVHEAKNDVEQAVSTYRASLAREPDNPTALHHLGQLLVQTGRYAEAEPMFQRAIERWPDSIVGYRNLGGVYYLQGDIDKAAAMTQRALEIEPSGSLYSNLGTLYFMQGHYRKATDAFERVMDMPHMASRYQAWANLADAYRWTPGKKDQARGTYRRAIELLRRELESKPDDLTLGSRLALYLAKSGDTDAALEALGAIAIPDNNANGLYRAAVAYEICEQRQQALETLDRALHAGYSAKEIQSDPELLQLRDDRRYHELMINLSR